MALQQLCEDVDLGCQFGYLSGVLTGTTDTVSLDIMNKDSFTYMLSNTLRFPQFFYDHWTDKGINHATFCGQNTIKYNADDPDFWFFNGSPTSTPKKLRNNAQVALYLIPECSAYVAGYSALVIKVYIGNYKILGARNFSGNPAIFSIKDCGRQSKLCCQLELSAVKLDSDCPGISKYTTLTHDLNTSDIEAKTQLIKLLYLFLASYHNVVDMEQSSDLLCNELATVIYRNVILPWCPEYRKSIIDDIKYKWLKPQLML